MQKLIAALLKAASGKIKVIVLTAAARALARHLGGKLPDRTRQALKALLAALQGKGGDSGGLAAELRAAIANDFDQDAPPAARRKTTRRRVRQTTADSEPKGNNTDGETAAGS